jgi:hypothetical protein
MLRKRKHTDGLAVIVHEKLKVLNMRKTKDEMQGLIIFFKEWPGIFPFFLVYIIYIIRR